MKNLYIGPKIIGYGHPVFIIAEVGINHQGNVDIAKKLIVKAKECGADAVKFQKRTISRILTREGLDMPYINDNSFGPTYGEHKSALELSSEDYLELFSFAQKQGILFCASGWDEESVDFLDKMGVLFFKIASADLTNRPLLEYTARKEKPIIISTGMAQMSDVLNAYKAITRWNLRVGVLQCTSTYPSRFEDINLNVLKTYHQTFPDAVIGYSGHEQGIAVSTAAVALGACIIERHFTLDRTMKGSDHAASLEPPGFAKMVRDIRHIEAAMGYYKKCMQESEKPLYRKLAKSIVSAVYIEKGQIILENMLTTKGPGTGIPPTKLDSLIGLQAARTIPADSVITESDIIWCPKVLFQNAVESGSLQLT